MAAFDFVTVDELRESLEADYAELDKCVEAGAWKAAHVLAGSIVEALLTDFLISRDDPTAPSAEELAKMSLGQIIRVCRDMHALTSRTVDLSSVIREYRNLIHPGRRVRLAEHVDAQTAQVARSLVEIVVAEVANKKQQEYGYTAAQLVDKLEADSSAVVIVPHLIMEMKPRELERFLLKEAPERYFEIEVNAAAQPALRSFEQAFRVVLSAVDYQVKQKLASKFVRMLKEDHEVRIGMYERAFIRGPDLAECRTNRSGNGESPPPGPIGAGID